MSSKNNSDLFEAVKKAFDDGYRVNWDRSLREISSVENFDDIAFEAHDGVLVSLDDDNTLRHISAFRSNNENIPVIGVSSFEKNSAGNGKHDEASSEAEKTEAHLDEIAFLEVGGDTVRSIKQPKILVEAYKAVARLRQQTAPKLFAVDEPEDENIITCGLLSLDCDKQALYYGGKSFREWRNHNPRFKDLTVKEFKILSELMRNPECLKGYNQLAEILDIHVKNPTNSVQSHVKRLRVKLGAFLSIDTDITPVETVYGGGLRFNPDKIPPLDAGALEPVNGVADLSAPSV